jgi:ubiquinone/menaquinone biosynthesis C-methylase UbiE
MTVRGSDADYLQAEWDQFLAHPVLGRRTLDAVAAWDVATVLDVGCGAGQELIPFLTGKGANGVGIDISVTTVSVARKLLTGVGLGDKVQLVCAKAEELPLRSGSFDAVVCRGVLFYVDNRRALTEIRRVVRPRGVVLIQVDNLRKALHGLRRQLLARNPRLAHVALRKTLAGVVFQLSGRQPKGAWAGAELAYSRRLLTRELMRAGFTIVADVPHGNPDIFAVVATPRPDQLTRQP